MERPDTKRWSDGGENGLGLRIKRDRVADDGEGVRSRAPRTGLCRRHIQVLGCISASTDREDAIPGTCKDPRSTLVEHRALN
jgi:hypothetical protein